MATSFSLADGGTIKFGADEEITLTHVHDVGLQLLNTKPSTTTKGGAIRLTCDDGALMASGHRLGVIEFAGAEDNSNTITVGARIEALCDADWSDGENGASLAFYTTDGNASQSEHMRITSDGNVGIGTTAPKSALHVFGIVDYTPDTIGIHMGHIYNNTNRNCLEFCGSVDTMIDFTTPGVDTKGRLYYEHSSHYMSFITNSGGSGGGEQMRIDSTGDVGIGITIPVTKLHVDGALMLGDVLTVPSASPWTSANSQLILAGDHNTDYNHGNKCKLLITGYDNENLSGEVYPIYCEDENGRCDFHIKSAPAGEYYSTAFFGLKSKVGIGITSPETALHVKSSTTDDGGDLSPITGAAITITNSNNQDWRMGVNGNADFTFWFDLADRAHLKDTVAAGELDFTGQHRSLMNNNISSSSVGLIVSSTNNYINTDNSVNPKINESLPFCVITSTTNDKKVFGVISDKEDTETNREFGMGTFVSVFAKHNTNEQRLHINSVGEGGMWISNKNGSLEGGDYITSTTVIGYGGKQSDDLLHNYTVAKITCDCNFSLTKIVKHKLKVSQTVEGQNIDYDVNGDVQYEDDLDTSGNQQMVYPLETRFLQSDGTQLTDETDYTTRLAAGESVYIACFVGCTYHCG